MHQYLSYSEDDFEVFLPRRSHTLHRWGWNLACPLLPHWCNSKGIGLQKWNFYWDLIKMWYINAPQGRIPCAIFTKFAEFVPRFRMRQLLKFRWICSRGYGVMGVLSWQGLVIPKFSATPGGETMRQTPEVFEVQERARGPLSPCQVWWGSDFTHRRGGQNTEFFVCLSVRRAFKCQSLWAWFWHEGVRVPKRF